HAMAPNTATDDVPFQGACRAVMRTAGAVVGLTRQKRLVVPRAYGLQDLQASRNTWCLARLPGRRAKPFPQALQAWTEPFDNQVSVQLAVHGEERLTRVGILAEHAWALRHIVETVAQLRLNEGTLLLDHDNLFQPSSKAPYNLRIERINQPEAQDTYPQALQRGTV